MDDQRAGCVERSRQSVSAATRPFDKGAERIFVKYCQAGLSDEWLYYELVAYATEIYAPDRTQANG